MEVDTMAKQQTGMLGQTRTAEGPTVPAAIIEHMSRTEEGFTFIASDGEETFYSFEDLGNQMLSRGQHLLDLGLKKGDRVAFVIPEPEDFVLNFLGALAVGVVPVPMYPPLSMGKLDAYIESSARIIEASRAKMLLTDKRVQNILWSLVDEVDTLDSLRTVDHFNIPNKKKERPTVDHLTHEDLAFLQFTSGSTSHPKGVVVTHGSLLANLDGIMNVGLRISPDDVAISWLPLYHDMGLIGFMLAPIWYGVPTVYMSPITFVKRPWMWMETASRFKGSISFAPNFAYALATRRTKPEKVAEYDLSPMKALGCGAEPNHPETLQNFLDHFAPAGLKPEALLPCYGMAEATLAITFVDLDETMTVDRVDGHEYQTKGVATPAAEDSDSVLEFVCCGRPFPEHEVLVVDERGGRLAERHVGEIIVRGPSITPGYFEEPEKTAAAFTDLGLMTGDLGYMADGQLYVTGRKKDVIILNGRNYDPQSIEWVVQEIEGIRKGNVVAFSVPGTATEELIIAAEVKRDVKDFESLEKAVKKAVRQELMVSPGDVALVQRGQLPKTSSGKLQRTKTRAQYMNGELGAEGERVVDARGDKATVAKHVAKSAVTRVRHGVKERASAVISRITGE